MTVSAWKGWRPRLGKRVVAYVGWGLFSLGCGWTVWGHPPGPDGVHQEQVEPRRSPLPSYQERLTLQRVGTVDSGTVRVAYLIPTNRVAQPQAEYWIQSTLLAYQWWFRKEMERNGYGPRTFRLELDDETGWPRVHVVEVHRSDEYLRGDLWGRTLDAASAAGVPVWTPGQVWWLIPEAHRQRADGGVEGGAALGASFGSGNDPGVALIGSDGLARFDPGQLTDNRTYAGRILSGIGTYPLRQDISFPWFEGNTLSSIASSIVGAGLHEIGHGFGLSHDPRNDENFRGNLMNNGLRGFRGALYPDRYGADATRLSHGQALALSVSRYFQPVRAYTDNTRPLVTVRTGTSVVPSNGLVTVEFRASDVGGLAAAWLLWKGDLVEEMALSGTVITQRFRTPYWSPGEANEYKVGVFDTSGNRTDATRVITASSGFNAAPRPHLKVRPEAPMVGQVVSFDASLTTDPDHNLNQLKFEWDFDGDGIYDTVPASNPRITRPYAAAGQVLVRVRVTDALGAWAVSAPMAMEVGTAEDREPRLRWRWVPDGWELAWSVSPFGARLESTDALGGSGSWQTVTSSVPVLWGASNRMVLPTDEAHRVFRTRRP